MEPAPNHQYLSAIPSRVVGDPLGGPGTRYTWRQTRGLVAAAGELLGYASDFYGGRNPFVAFAERELDPAILGAAHAENSPEANQRLARLHSAAKSIGNELVRDLSVARVFRKAPAWSADALDLIASTGFWRSYSPSRD